MRIKYIFFTVLLFIAIHPAINAEECRTWFKNAGLKFDEDCLLECSIIKTDMKTFHCPLMCDKLCKSPIKEHFILKTSALYPALTKEERVLSAQYPKKMLKAYNLSWKARNMCRSVFKANKPDDISDACRHFIWSSLLYKQFGMDFSQKVLNAHEQNLNQSQESKAMDLANNRIGIMTAQKLIQTGKYKESKLVQVFKEKLKAGDFVILEK